MSRGQPSPQISQELHNGIQCLGSIREGFLAEENIDGNPRWRSTLFTKACESAREELTGLSAGHRVWAFVACLSDLGG